MKKIILMAAMMIGCMCAMAQDVFKNDTVIQVEGLEAKVIYSRLRDYVIHNFTNSEKVLQIEDEEKGRMVGSFTIEYEDESITRNYLYGMIDVTFEILCRDGRFRFICSEYRHRGVPKKWVIQNPVTFGLLYTDVPNPCPTQKYQYKSLVKHILPYLRLEFKGMSVDLKYGAYKETTSEEDW